MRIDTTRKINFGVYKGTYKTTYGRCVYGSFKDKNIKILTETPKQKFYYVEDKFGNWIKSKWVYFENLDKKTIVHDVKNIYGKGG